MTQFSAIELEADRYEDELNYGELPLNHHGIEVTQQDGLYTAQLVGTLDGWNLAHEAERPELAAAALRLELKTRGFTVPARTIYA